MRLILGVDEAGYGPNMGPLVIAVSAWLVESDFDVLDGLAPFEPEFLAAPWNPQCDFVPFGDSKKIYQPSKGLRGLSVAIRFFESILTSKPAISRPWFALGNLAHQDIKRVESLPWYDRSLNLPDQVIDDLLTHSALVFSKEKLVKLGVQLVDFRLRVIDEAYFNKSVESLGNKSDVLGQSSLNLTWQVLQDTLVSYPCKAVEIYCDRQGGRKKYAGLLSHTFQTSHALESVPFISASLESPQSSLYSMHYRDIPTTIRFQVEGDSLFPPAASSMVAKWTREILMGRLNRYWQGVVGSTLRPTAGYAVDAARFAQDIGPWIDQLGFEKNHWWRMR
ncbi:MAG: hypothetical protein ACK5LQ_04170 [Planctomycetota bacterium]